MILLDTHILVWFMEGDAKLGNAARDRIGTAIDEESILVSAITPWEIAMLVRKGRMELSRSVKSWISHVLNKDGIVLAPLEPEIAIESVLLPGEFHKDPADRIIIATARHHNVPLLTRDGAILDYGAAGHLDSIDARL